METMKNSEIHCGHMELPVSTEVPGDCGHNRGSSRSRCKVCQKGLAKQVEELRAKGCGYRTIARKLGWRVSYQTIRRHLLNCNTRFQDSSPVGSGKEVLQFEEV